MNRTVHSCKTVLLIVASVCALSACNKQTPPTPQTDAAAQSSIPGSGPDTATAAAAAAAAPAAPAAASPRIDGDPGTPNSTPNATGGTTESAGDNITAGGSANSGGVSHAGAANHVPPPASPQPAK